MSAKAVVGVEDVVAVVAGQDEGVLMMIEAIVLVTVVGAAEEAGYTRRFFQTINLMEPTETKFQPTKPLASPPLAAPLCRPI